MRSKIASAVRMPLLLALALLPSPSAHHMKHLIDDWKVCVVVYLNIADDGTIFLWKARLIFFIGSLIPQSFPWDQNVWVDRQVW